MRSSSHGNCYYLGLPDCHLLIDAGIAFSHIRRSLKDMDLDISQINAVLVTHDHSDHIKTVGSLSDKYNIPIYATRPVIAGINKSVYVKHPPISSYVIIEKEKEFAIRSFLVTAFEVPHDASDCVGYLIETPGHTFVFASDMGYITPTASKYIARANHLVIEANYDIDMLQHGVYPQQLKERVGGSMGHLSNQETAEYLANHYSPHLKDIWLCHLSGDNNLPELAYKTISERLLQSGIRTGEDVNLSVLNRTKPSELWHS
jgi:phosphoribosyl 1,2-cyclic phosphodiesterase